MAQHPFDRECVEPLGVERQAQVVRLAHAHGMRVIGPNCLGVLNTDSTVRLNATLAPTVPEGQAPWDLQPGSVMTNAKVSSIVVAAEKRELTLQYKDGTAKIHVPENAPIVRAVPGARSDLRPGEYVFAAVQTAQDGTMTAPRVQVSKDGVRPPQ